MQKFTCKVIALIILISLCVVPFTACKIFNKPDEFSEGLLGTLKEDYYGTYISVSKGHCQDEHVIIPKTYKDIRIKEIAPNGFKDYKTLKSISLPSSIEVISNFAFQNCINLESINLDGNLGIIGVSAFEGCSSLKNVVIGNNVSYLHGDAFKDCISLEEIRFSNRLKNVNLSNVSGCVSLEKIYIGTKTEMFYPFASNLNSLKLIELSPDNNHFTVIDNVLYSKDGTKLIYYPSGKTGVFTVPQQVTSIANGAFYGSMLDKVIVHKDVKTIGESAFSSAKIKSVVINGQTTIGESAFKNSNVKEVYINDLNVSMSYKTFTESNVETVYYIGNENDWEKIFPYLSDMLYVRFSVVYNYTDK